MVDKNKEEPKKGRVTIPTDASAVEETKRLAALWGADAIRDCDGTVLPKDARSLAKDVYSTYFVVRGDNGWARAHPLEAPCAFLTSKSVIAPDASPLRINPLEEYLVDQIAPAIDEEKRWQIFDQTTGLEVKGWSIENGIVVLEKPVPFHAYIVYFLARIIWHPTQVYNYLMNHWTCEKQLVYDPAYPLTGAYIREHLRKWLQEHPETTVVRFTTFFYNFSLYFRKDGKEKFVNWFGYGLTASPALLDAFEKETGQTMTAADFVDGGCFNSPFRLVSHKFQAYMDFIGRFVTATMKEMVGIVHEAGRKAMMFLGDDWIGSEPYGPHFKDMDLDAVVGSVGGGVTIRMLGEIPNVRVHEGRFLPYFFPDTFFPGNEENAVKELNFNWPRARRALLRQPLERMGFGGYLALTAQFPRFVERVGVICGEFRSIADSILGVKPYSVLTVGILNYWGRLRSWQAHMVAHELWYQQVYSYQGVYEALSGLPVQVRFLSFEDVLKDGVPADVDVLLNVGQEGTAFSGGEAWANPKLVALVREYVAKGHGFLGVGEPTAFQKDGQCFALKDVLGVEKEKGFTLSEDKYNILPQPSFITEGLPRPLDYGESEKNIYALPETQVIDIALSPRYQRNVNVGEVLLSSHDYFSGRGVYLAGLPYSAVNARLLYRSLLYAAHKEKDLDKNYAASPEVECSYYPEKKLYAIVNNSAEEISTLFYDNEGKGKPLHLEGNELRWIKE